MRLLCRRAWLLRLLRLLGLRLRLGARLRWLCIALLRLRSGWSFLQVAFMRTGVATAASWAITMPLRAAALRIPVAGLLAARLPRSIALRAPRAVVTLALRPTALWRSLALWRRAFLAFTKELGLLLPTAFAKGAAIGASDRLTVLTHWLTNGLPKELHVVRVAHTHALLARFNLLIHKPGEDILVRGGGLSIAWCARCGSWCGRVIASLWQLVHRHSPPSRNVLGGHIVTESIKHANNTMLDLDV